MSESQRHVLIWLTPEFLQSSGMIRLFTEAGIFSSAEEDLEGYIRSAVDAGGFALTGTLTDANHGAGIWISPVGVPGLQIMIPWHFLKSVVTAESPRAPKAFGLLQDLASEYGPDLKGTEQIRKTDGQK